MNKYENCTLAEIKKVFADYENKIGSVPGSRIWRPTATVTVFDEGGNQIYSDTFTSKTIGDRNSSIRLIEAVRGNCVVSVSDAVAKMLSDVMALPDFGDYLAIRNAEICNAMDNYADAESALYKALTGKERDSGEQPDEKDDFESACANLGLSRKDTCYPRYTDEADTEPCFLKGCGNKDCVYSPMVLRVSGEKSPEAARKTEIPVPGSRSEQEKTSAMPFFGMQASGRRNRSSSPFVMTPNGFGFECDAESPEELMQKAMEFAKSLGIPGAAVCGFGDRNPATGKLVITDLNTQVFSPEPKKYDDDAGCGECFCDGEDEEDGEFDEGPYYGPGISDLFNI